MRNLKKFLALVLAMVMAFSLMLSVNAATTGTQYPDASQVNEKFVEAVDVLTGMKVFQGDEGTNNFRPTSNITRGEVAAIIYRLATGDTNVEKKDLYYTTAHPFTDVSENDWFAGYVGYCWNAGIIKGMTNTTFDPYSNVTGYQVLAMILRAMGYDAQHEFEGTNWRVNVSAIATQRQLLVDVNSTHYANTLDQYSAREVVASILFHAAQKTRVKYTPAYGYQSGDYNQVEPEPGRYNDYTSLGKLHFGLTYDEDGVLIGNQQTGEKNSVLGHTGRAWGYIGSYSQYTWAANNYTIGYLDENGDPQTSTGALGNNWHYDIQTGIDKFGHQLRIWYNDGTGTIDYGNSIGTSTKPYHVYAWYDDVADHTVVKADNADLTGASAVPGTVNLYDAIEDAGYKVNSYGAVFSNSFSRFGADDNTGVPTADGFSTPNNYGIGLPSTNPATIKSPVKLYKIIDNDGDKKIDAIISLNIETSQITESNNVNRVPTLGIPVGNGGNGEGAIVWNNDTAADTVKDMSYIDTSAKNTAGAKNVKKVPATAADGVNTGVIAQDAVVAGTKTLGDYVLGIHITGTSPRNVSDAEKSEINVDNPPSNTPAGTGTETARFYLYEVAQKASGKVIAFNRENGTVTLDTGKTLERSLYYDTVVCTVSSQSGTAATVGKTRLDHFATDTPHGSDTYALPQSVDADGLESYNASNYTFYLDHEGKYLGAKRGYDVEFIYGTYVDYEQPLNTSTFTYYLTGVGLDGEPVTRKVEKHWVDGLTGLQADRTTVSIMGTDDLGVPYLDTHATGGQMNYIGAGRYKGYILSDTTLDNFSTAPAINEGDYEVNMQRMDILYAGDGTDGIDDTTKISIGSTEVTLGAVETKLGVSNLYFTDDTTFIVVDGYGTDSIKKTEVYKGLKGLLGDASKVWINLDKNDTSNADADNDGNSMGVTPALGLNQRLIQGTENADMTYFMKSPYVFAQSGDVAEKVDVIILPITAVKWVDKTSSSLYYVGDPNYTLISSHNGTPIYQYTMYDMEGNAEQKWLTNAVAPAAGGWVANEIRPDTFYSLTKTDKKTTDGSEVYDAVVQNSSYDGTGRADKRVITQGVFRTTGRNALNATVFIPTTSGADVATTYDGTTVGATKINFSALNHSALYRTDGAKVVNLNAANSPKINTTSSGYVWSGVGNDLGNVNDGGSINPVTGRAMKVSAVTTSTGGLTIQTIFVCWDQNVNITG